MDKPISVGELGVILQSEMWPHTVGWVALVVGEAGSREGHRQVVIEHPPVEWCGRQVTQVRIYAHWLRRIPPMDELKGVDEHEPVYSSN